MTTAQLDTRPKPPVDRPLTAEEFGELPDCEPCELIRGRVVPLTYSGLMRSLLATKTAFRLAGYAKDKGLGQVFVGQVGIVLERNPDTVRGPDVGFICTGRMPPQEELDEYLKVPPDLCVEVVSPGDRWPKITEKVDMFLAFGVTLVWVIDPQTRTAHVYRKGREVRVVQATGSLEGEDVLPGFMLPLAELFGELG